MSLNPTDSPVTRRSTMKAGRDGVAGAIAFAITTAITGRVDLSPEEAVLVYGALTVLCTWGYRMLRDRGMLAPEAGV